MRYESQRPISYMLTAPLLPCLTCYSVQKPDTITDYNTPLPFSQGTAGFSLRFLSQFFMDAGAAVFRRFANRQHHFAPDRNALNSISV